MSSINALNTEAKKVGGLKGTLSIGASTWTCEIFVNQNYRRTSVSNWGIRPMAYCNVSTDARNNFRYENGYFQPNRWFEEDQKNKVRVIFESERLSFVEQHFLTFVLPNSSKTPLENDCQKTYNDKRAVLRVASVVEFWHIQMKYLMSGTTSMFKALTRDWMNGIFEELEKLEKNQTESIQSEREKHLVGIVVNLMDPDSDRYKLNFEDDSVIISKEQCIRLGGFFKICVESHFHESESGEIDLTKSGITKDLFIRGYSHFELKDESILFDINEYCVLANFSRCHFLEWCDALNKALLDYLDTDEKIIEVLQLNLTKFDRNVRLLQLNAVKRAIFDFRETERKNVAINCFLAFDLQTAKEALEADDLKPHKEISVFYLAKAYCEHEPNAGKDETFSIFESVRYDLMPLDDLIQVRDNKNKPYHEKVLSLVKKHICKKAKPGYAPKHRKRVYHGEYLDQKTLKLLGVMGLLE